MKAEQIHRSARSPGVAIEHVVGASHHRDLGAPVSWPLEKASRWLTYTVEGELLMNQISEASKRISALVADAKQYSQLDRAPSR